MNSYARDALNSNGGYGAVLQRAKICMAGYAQCAAESMHRQHAGEGIRHSLHRLVFPASGQVCLSSGRNGLENEHVSMAGFFEMVIAALHKRCVSKK